MSDDSSFSVLMSLYFNEKSDYLELCLASILSQSLLPKEIILVYDGPITAELREVVEKYKDELNIYVIELESNVGLGNALNIGLKYCNNDYVIRMDTDDICLSERFEKQMAYLKNHPYVALLGGGINNYDEDMSASKGIRFSVSEHSEIIHYCKKRNPFNHMTVAFKKSVIEKVGGYQHHLFMEDYNLWLRVIAAGYLTHNMDCVLVNARAGSSMIRRRKGIHYIKSEIKMAQLKYELKIDSLAGVISCAFIRILPRLLPLPALEFIYKNLRK